MEGLLDLYQRPYDPLEPMVAMDETTKQLIKELIAPLPPQPGQSERYDSLYERAGVATLFMFFEPLSGWRKVSVRAGKTRLDWAAEVRELLEVHYPQARKIHLVMDNLNTHGGASLYEAFPAQQARQMLARLEFHYTPRHGSWLNVAEIELSILSRQCLARRIGDAQTLIREVEAWQSDRNNRACKVNWQFTTEKARIKLQHLYPSI